MTKITVYGIRSCDAMRAAFDWLGRRKVDYVFHDYKKTGADEAILKQAIKIHGWEQVLNRKGTTWRNLPQAVRDAMTEATALKTALENTSVIRRPMVVKGEKILLGFDEGEFGEVLG